jgi:hypothetical protein
MFDRNKGNRGSEYSPSESARMLLESELPCMTKSGVSGSWPKAALLSKTSESDMGTLNNHKSDIIGISPR